MSRVVPLRRPVRRPRPGAPATRAAPSRRMHARISHRPGVTQRMARGVWSGWFLGKVLAVAVLAAGAWLFIEGAASPDLRVASILVAGNDLVPAEEIAEVLPVRDANVFTIRGSRLAPAILSDPAVAAVRVEPRLPDAVYVRVMERRPAVVWETTVGSVLADRTGLVLREGESALPTVSAPDGPFPQPGERVSPQAVQVAETVGPLIDSLGLKGGRIEFRPESGVTLVAPGAARVVLGFGDDLQLKLDAYTTIRRYLEQSRTTAELIDVRFLDRPYYR
jgi:cell division septal protein FtsQ